MKAVNVLEPIEILDRAVGNPCARNRLQELIAEEELSEFVNNPPAGGLSSAVDNFVG